MIKKGLESEKIIYELDCGKDTGQEGSFLMLAYVLRKKMWSSSLQHTQSPTYMTTSILVGHHCEITCSESHVNNDALNW